MLSYMYTEKETVSERGNTMYTYVCMYVCMCIDLDSAFGGLKDSQHTFVCVLLRVVTFVIAGPKLRELSSHGLGLLGLLGLLKWL